jgi:pyrrolidone-carboxylate peptidase
MRAPLRTFVTGFHGFGGFAVNPSALLAESCGRPFELLEVSYHTVDEFLHRLARSSDSFDQILMLGLRARGTTMDVENVARNWVEEAPDVRRAVRGPAPIEVGAPDTMQSTLFDGAASVAPLSPGDDAGCYLCNYIYYRALRLLPAKRVGFVHVPPTTVMPLDAQRHSLARLLDAIETSAASA